MSDDKVVVLSIARTVLEALAKLVPTKVRMTFKLSIELRTGKRKDKSNGARKGPRRDRPSPAGPVRTVAILTLCYFVTQVLLMGLQSMTDHTVSQEHVQALATVLA